MNIDTDSNNKSLIVITESLPVRTQFLIFTLFGEYVVQRGGSIWTSSMLLLMGLLGVSERAVRSTLSRMRRKGWITPKRYGRRSQYAVTSRGLSLLNAGQRRIFEPFFSTWDDRWQLVVYSLPENKREKRHALRKQLTWLGFGRLAPGIWISPHDRRVELISLLDELEVNQYVDLFSRIKLETSSARDMVSRCWDLDDLESQYQDFIARYTPEYNECLARTSNKHSISPQECFIRRFWLTHEFQFTPMKDPNLPTTLLPKNWIGFTARKLFDDYHQLLGRGAEQFVDEVMNGTTAYKTNTY